MCFVSVNVLNWMPYNTSTGAELTSTILQPSATRVYDFVWSTWVLSVPVCMLNHPYQVSSNNAHPSCTVKSLNPPFHLLITKNLYSFVWITTVSSSPGQRKNDKKTTPPKWLQIAKFNVCLLNDKCLPTKCLLKHSTLVLSMLYCPVKYP